MKQSIFPPVKEWLIPTTVLPDSIAEMARDGLMGNEGIVLWLGRRLDGEATITHLVALRGPGVDKSAAFLRISTDLMNTVTDVAINLGVSLIGQIHSHGPFYGTDLSFTDIKYGIAVPDYLSIVAPDYSLNRATKLKDCGIHVFHAEEGYKRLSSSEFEHRFHMVPGDRPPMLQVGMME